MKEENIKLYLDNKTFRGTEEEFLAIEEFKYKEWKLNNKKHRNGGPAYISKMGVEIWYQNGKWHRDGGPAYSNRSGYKSWHQNGKVHREDGPAIERGVHEEFYLEGKKVSPNTFKKRTEEYKKHKEKLLSVQEDIKTYIKLSFKPNEIDEAIRIYKTLKEYEILKSILNSQKS